MAGRRPLVPALCLAALAAGIVVVLGVVRTAEASGRPALAARARAFTKLLEQPAVRASDVQPFLAPGASLEDPRVREALEALHGTLRNGSLVAEVRTTGGSRGETEVFLLSAGQPGALAGTLTFAWTRTRDGAWVFDPIAR